MALAGQTVIIRLVFKPLLNTLRVQRNPAYLTRIRSPSLSSRPG
ncbi:MAG: hypothetical protein HLUCCO03_08130 [Marinobacter sp. HL-58]|nr:MAG: hypothetical protein HLUCCO03_08130 [Marinobacter sp. HL-58]